jgi:hypothetical protein
MYIDLDANDKETGCRPCLESRCKLEPDIACLGSTIPWACCQTAVAIEDITCTHQMIPQKGHSSLSMIAINAKHWGKKGLIQGTISVLGLGRITTGVTCLARILGPNIGSITSSVPCQQWNRKRGNLYHRCYLGLSQSLPLMRSVEPSWPAQVMMTPL